MHMFPIFDGTRPEVEETGYVNVDTSLIESGELGAGHSGSVSDVESQIPGKGSISAGTTPQPPAQSTYDKLASSASPSQGILDWGSSIMNMSPFKSSGTHAQSNSIHNPIQHSTPLHGSGVPSNTNKLTPRKRVAYIAIQFSNFNEK